MLVLLLFPESSTDFSKEMLVPRNVNAAKEMQTDETRQITTFELMEAEAKVDKTWSELKWLVLERT